MEKCEFLRHGVPSLFKSSLSNTVPLQATYPAYVLSTAGINIFRIVELDPPAPKSKSARMLPGYTPPLSATV